MTDTPDNTNIQALTLDTRVHLSPRRQHRPGLRARERQRQAGRRPRGTRRSGRLDTWNPALYRARHRLLKAHERLNGRERRRLVELFEREPVLAEAWGLKETFRAIYRAPNRAEAERRLDAFLTAVDHAGRRHSTRSPKASGSGATSCWPTSTNRPPTATPKASSTKSKSSSAAPTGSRRSPPSATASS
jgi:hypothetical protein